MSGAIDLENSSGEWTDFLGGAWDFVQEGAMTFLDFEQARSSMEREYVADDRPVITSASTDTAKPSTGLYIGLGLGGLLLLLMLFVLVKK